MANEVKWLHSAMTGAPTLSGTAGSLIAVLDACLVNGFASATVDSVVISGGVATVTRSAGHPFEVGSIVSISGATVTGGSINGEQTVLTTTATTYTFAAAGIGDQTATGTITHKVAPLGWTKQYSGTNLAAYKSSSGAATGCLLRVDDTSTTNARVVGYETMSDVNTGTGPFPTAAQVSGGGYWGKSQTADATTRPWVIVGDNRAFYLCVMWVAASGYSTQMFGDFVSNKSPDAYACALSVSTTNITASNPGTSASNDIAYCTKTTNVNTFAPRGVTGLGSSVGSVRGVLSCPVGADDATWSGASATSRMAYPNAADSGLYLSQMSFCDTSSFRGVYPGAYFLPQAVGFSGFASRDLVTGVTGYSGRSFRAVMHNSGPLMFDITGPWR